MNGTPLEHRLKSVKERIEQAAARAGRDASRIRLVAVGKTHPPELLEDAIRLGVTEIGENYVQEAQAKQLALKAHPVCWHFIGRMQSNKIKSLVGRFDLLHSVDSLKKAREIDQRAQEQSLVQKILLQVKLGAEDSKGGFSPDAFWREAAPVFDLPNVAVQGLMAIPAQTSHLSETRAFFRRLRELRDEAPNIDVSRHSFRELSMGMSADFEVAIEEGATLIRLGTVLFGTRRI